MCSPRRMSNVLKHEKQEQIRALGRLGWSLRRIEEATGVRRETVSRHLKAAGIVVRPPRQRCLEADSKAASHPITDSEPDSKAASQVTTDLEREPVAGWSPMSSRCEAFREVIETALATGRNAKSIWQELVDEHGFDAGYQSVGRFVRKLRGNVGREAHPTIVTEAGEEAQVDYGSGPMVRHPETVSSDGRSANQGAGSQQDGGGKRSLLRGFFPFESGFLSSRSRFRCGLLDPPGNGN